MYIWHVQCLFQSVHVLGKVALGIFQFISKALNVTLSPVFSRNIRTTWPMIL